MYGSKVRTYGNIWTIKRWGEWRKVRIFPMKYAMPDNGGIQLTGSEGAPKSRNGKLGGVVGASHFGGGLMAIDEAVAERLIMPYLS